MSLLIKDENGILRFKHNRVITHLLNVSKQNGTDLNLLWKMAENGQFTIWEMQELYQHMGYTLAGYEEIFEDKV